MKKIALWLCVCLACISGNAFAMEASVDYDTNLIAVSAPAQEQKTAVLVVRSKETGAYAYADLLFAQEDVFSAELKLDAAEGEYSVVLVRANDTEEELFDFVNVSEGTRSAIVQALSNVLSDADQPSSEQKLNAFVTQYTWAVGIDSVKYGALASKAGFDSAFTEKTTCDVFTNHGKLSGGAGRSICRFNRGKDSGGHQSSKCRGNYRNFERKCGNSGHYTDGCI